MNKKVLLIIGGVVLVMALCACVAVVGFVLYRVSQQTTDVLPTVAVAATDIPAPLAAPTQAPAADDPLPPTQPETNTSDSSYEGVIAADRLLSRMADHKYDDAAILAANELRNKGDVAAQLKTMVEDQGLEPDIWEWTNSSNNGGVRQFDGVIHFADKRRGVVTAQIIVEEGAYRFTYLNLKTTDGDIDPGQYPTWSDDRKNEEVAFARGAANGFLNYWQEKDFDGTWLLTAQPMKDTLGNDKQKLEAFLTGLKITPDTWTWEKGFDIYEAAAEHPVLVFKGTVNYKEGSSGPIEVQMKWEDGYWSVLYMDIKAN